MRYDVHTSLPRIAESGEAKAGNRQLLQHCRSQVRDIEFAEWKLGERSPAEVAEHIVAFTLSGIRATDTGRRRKR